MSYDVFISYNKTNIDTAKAVCHFLEERRLRCFFAPKNIEDPNWAETIYHAIHGAKAFVIILSKESIASLEVAKEIALATNLSEYIFPLRIDPSDLDGRTAYHLAPFHWIDAMTPPIEQKLNELADRVVACLKGQVSNLDLGNLSGNRNQSRWKLKSRYSLPRKDFIGRTNELNEIHQLFTSGCDCLFLTGMGGIGKSEIAKVYANTHSDIYTTVVFASYETDLLHLIASDQAIPVENLQQAAATGGQGETIEAYFARKMQVLHSILNPNTLLIIDNFDVENDPYLDDVLQLPCKFLFTSRTDFSAYGFQTVNIGPLENFEDLVTLMHRGDRLYSDAESQAAIRDIIRLLDCHTYAVSLTAAQMRASNLRPVKMLAQLQAEGLHFKTRSSFAHERNGKRATAYQYIQALFDFSRLEEIDNQILRYLACLPQEGVEVDLFMECCGIEDFYDIGRLVDLNWVQMDRETDRIGLHMLVKELVWDQLTPTEDNCEALLQGAYRWAKNAWNKPLDENCSHSSVIFSLLDVFRTPPIHWLDAFEDMATFAWILGRFDLSARSEHHLYQLCVDHHGASSLQAGNQALRVAAVYYNQGDYALARPWYEKGLAVLEAINPESVDTFIARTKIARSDAQLGQFDTSLAAFEKNLAIAKIFTANLQGDDVEVRKIRRHLYTAKLYLSLIYGCVGRFEEALPLAQEARDYMVNSGEQPAQNVYTLTTLTYLYQGLGEYPKAQDCAEKALADTIRLHGENRIDVVLIQECLGDLMAKQGQFPEAAELYSVALVRRKKLYPADLGAIRQLEEKLDCVKQNAVPSVPFRLIWC